MNFDISSLCYNFLFIINRLIKFIKKKCNKKKQMKKRKPKKKHVSKNMPPCHFYIAIAIESSLKIRKRTECF